MTNIQDTKASTNIIVAQTQGIDIDNSNAMITTNNEEKEIISFDKIDLSVVSYDRKFSRNRGTLSQIVKSLEDMISRLETPTNDYQKGLYPHIQGECKTLVEFYVNKINNVSKTDYETFGYYLNGPKNNGKRKITTTPHEKKSYGVSEFKETLKSINDRLRHIKNNSMTKLTEKDNLNIEPYRNMIIFCDEYHKLIDQKLAEWDKFIGQFRTKNNINQTNTQNDNRTRVIITKIGDEKRIRVVNSTNPVNNPVRKNKPKQTNMFVRKSRVNIT